MKSNKAQSHYSHIDIIRVITLIRNSFPDSVEVYTNGSCVKFCMILLAIFPEGKILYDGCHAIFEIFDTCYDINGLAKKDNHIPIEQYGLIGMYELMNMTHKKSPN